MNTYVQCTGDWYKDGQFIATGYSGFDIGKNEPRYQEVHNLGCIPVGHWRIVGPPLTTSTHGPCVLRLEPKAGTETFGRFGFLLHGEHLAPAMAGEASRGCIVIGPEEVRQMIWKSGDHDLRVIATFSSMQLPPMPPLYPPEETTK